MPFLFFLISENHTLYVYMIVVKEEELNRYDFGHKRLIPNGSERSFLKMKTNNKIKDDVAKMCKVDVESVVEQDDHSIDINLSLDLSQLLEAAENDAEGTEDTEQFYRDLEDAIRAGLESAIDESENTAAIERLRQKFGGDND